MAFALGCCRQVEGGADKSAIMTQLMHRMQSNHTRQSQQGASQGAPQLAVYIGDSASDIGPLLQADLGIVVGQNQLLRRVAEAHGIAIKPLTAGGCCSRVHCTALTADWGTCYELTWVL